MAKLVRENLGSGILKPKSKEDVTSDIRRRLEDKVESTIKETPEYIIYKVKRGDDIRDIVKNFASRDEDIFYNFYVILDNTVAGFNQIIGVKVSPDGTITATNANGSSIEQSYLDKFV